MSEFNKTYKQLAKSYNFSINEEIIDEISLSDGWNAVKNTGKKIASGVSSGFSWLINILRKGKDAFCDMIQGWFNKFSEKNASSYSKKVNSMIEFGTNSNLCNEGIFDWFGDFCKQVKSGTTLMKSPEEFEKFKTYLTTEKNIKPEQFKNVSFKDCKEYLKDFTRKELPANNIVTQSVQKRVDKNGEVILQVGFLATTIGVTVCICIVFILGMILWNKLTKTDTEKALDKQIADNKAQEEGLKNTIEHRDKMNQLTVTQLTNALKGCEALK